jgi:hypothetical protein
MRGLRTSELNRTCTAHMQRGLYFFCAKRQIRLARKSLFQPRIWNRKHDYVNYKKLHFELLQLYFFLQVPGTYLSAKALKSLNYARFTNV